MSHISKYVKGDWLGDCEVCGATRLASELRMRWDGFRVDARCFETRQPQDFVRGIVDQQAPPWTAPEPTDTFVLACTTRTSIAGYASAGCLITGNTVNPGSVPVSTF